MGGSLAGGRGMGITALLNFWHFCIFSVNPCCPDIFIPAPQAAAIPPSRSRLARASPSSRPRLARVSASSRPGLGLVSPGSRPGVRRHGKVTSTPAPSLSRNILPAINNGLGYKKKKKPKIYYSPIIYLLLNFG